jgi:hypothetical protein
MSFEDQWKKLTSFDVQVTKQDKQFLYYWNLTYAHGNTPEARKMKRDIEKTYGNKFLSHYTQHKLWRTGLVGYQWRKGVDRYIDHPWENRKMVLPRKRIYIPKEVREQIDDDYNEFMAKSTLRIEMTDDLAKVLESAFRLKSAGVERKLYRRVYDREKEDNVWDEQIVVSDRDIHDDTGIPVKNIQWYITTLGSLGFVRYVRDGDHTTAGHVYNDIDFVFSDMHRQWLVDQNKTTRVWRIPYIVPGMESGPFASSAESVRKTQRKAEEEDKDNSWIKMWNADFMECGGTEDNVRYLDRGAMDEVERWALEKLIEKHKDDEDGDGWWRVKREFRYRVEMADVYLHLALKKAGKKLDVYTTPMTALGGEAFKVMDEEMQYGIIFTKLRYERINRILGKQESPSQISLAQEQGAAATG